MMSGVFSCWFLRSFLRQDDHTTGSMHPVFRRFMGGLVVADEWCFFVLVFEILPASGPYNGINYSNFYVPSFIRVFSLIISVVLSSYEGRISFLKEITLASKHVNGNLFLDLGSAKRELQNRNDETSLTWSLRIILFSPAPSNTEITKIIESPTE